MSNTLKPVLFARIFGIAGLWILASECLRFFPFVAPPLREYLAPLQRFLENGVAPITLPIFLSWMVWTAILTACLIYITWLCLCHYRNRLLAVFIGATLTWLSFFVLFWIGMINMALTPPSLLALALPWAWIEMLVAAVITWQLLKRAQALPKHV